MSTASARSSGGSGPSPHALTEVHYVELPHSSFGELRLEYARFSDDCAAAEANW